MLPRKNQGLFGTGLNIFKLKTLKKALKEYVAQIIGILFVMNMDKKCGKRKVPITGVFSFSYNGVECILLYGRENMLLFFVKAKNMKNIITKQVSCQSLITSPDLSNIILYK